MSLFDRMAKVVRDYMGTWSSGDKALANLFGGQGPSTAGVNVTEETSLNISAVWACVQLIAGNIASLPLFHYRIKGTGDREKNTSSKLYHLLHDAPNEEMTASTFLETLQTHILLWGNGFAEILRNGRGEIVELYPIEPWRVAAVRPNGLLGDLRYKIAQRDGSNALLTPDQIVHVPGLSPNGVWGYSVIRKARESFGLTMAEERFAASFFGQGSTFGGLLSVPGVLSAENERRLRDSLELRHKGVDRAHQFVILQGGVDYKPLGIPGRDAQFLQQRQFQTGEIARWFGVPPHLIGDVDKSTSWGTGIQQQTIGFLQFTLRRWLVKWEKELNRKLISPLERNLQLIEFNVDGLERGDQESRYRAYTTGIQWGFLTRNEVRHMENLPRIDEGDEALVPSNMTTMEKLTAPEPAPALPAAPPPPDEGDAEAEADRQLIAAFRAEVAQADERIAGRFQSQAERLTETWNELKAREDRHAQEREAILARLDALPTPATPDDVAGVGGRIADGLRGELQAHSDRVAGMVPMLLEWIAAEIRKETRFEADRALRAAQGGPDKLRPWMEAFYAGREAEAVQRLLPTMRLYMQLVGRLEDAEEATRHLVQGFVAESREALEAVLSDPENLERHVRLLTASWIDARPRSVVEMVLKEVVAHA